MENSPISVNLEVSDFLYDLGVLLHMNYSASGSLANSHRTLEAFHELGYFNGILLRKSKFTSESWSEIFYQNLSEYKPILVTGGGHAFICDGYSPDGLFHFNLGWDGYGDGYYPLNCVMTLPVNEAFTELEPISWPKPPKYIGLKTLNRQSFLSWGYESDQKPVRSRVYADDQLLLETIDTLLNISQMNPGAHVVYVSAVYPDGESRWIGPQEIFIPGAPLTISDPRLYRVIQNALGHVLSDTKELQIYEGDLSRITSLDIDQPVTNMEGLGLCNHLKRLIIHGFPGLALDAGPLENLMDLRILEWYDRPMTHPEVLFKLSRLSELRIRQTPLESLDFLKGYNNLMKFEYSDAPVGNHDAIPGLPLLDELVLSRTNLSNAGFISLMPQLIRLNLSGNNLTETGFLYTLSSLERANLSDNHITKLLLTDQLQSLHELDVSDNDITVINITADLKLLHFLDLSGNKLVTPGRLFLYTPALTKLDLSDNSLRDIGKQRCLNLEILDVSNNQLITTEWISMQPRLKSLDLEHNRISDLSGLKKNNLFRQLNFLGLDKNPLSKQSFLESLPILIEAIDSVSKPMDYQPLSPCYLSPASGSQLVGSKAQFQWFADDSSQKCVYDLYIVKGDSMVPLLQGIDTSMVALDYRPAPAFSWVVASRTADSVYYSGINDVTATAQWSVPFIDGFETYLEGEPLSQQSDFWFITEDTEASDGSARIVSSNSNTGLNSLGLEEGETAILPTSHLELPYICIEFSALIPSGQSGEFRVQNLNGMYFRLVWDASDTGKLIINDKIYCTFTVDHLNWTDYEIVAHARNNNYYVKVGNQSLINESWMVPEGIICTESIEFASLPDADKTKSYGNKLFIDDVKITSATGTSGIGIDRQPADLIGVYPNPFTDFVNVSFPEPGRYDISIIDITGREVYRQMIDAKMNTVNTIPLSGLAPGIYILHAGNPMSKPVKVVKNRSGI
ncbi:MAG: C10 family peptidase [Bacteroidia bacterium]|nr:C10 family peptidase [Bacteroidia bacterium]